MIEKVIIMGAAGRDFHNFNIYFKDNSRYNVVAFTATQIPDIEGRVYPPELAVPAELYIQEQVKVGMEVEETIKKVL